MIGCIIQARMSSTRLHGKILKKLDEKKTVLDYVLDQVKCSKKIDDIIVATTNLKKDDIIVSFSQRYGVKFFRGSSQDVLDRYYKCAKKFSFSIIVRITSDNPLIDPEIIDKAILKFKSGSYDLVTTCNVRSFPYGISVEVFSFNALETAWKNALLPHEREHVSPYFIENSDKFRIFNLVNSENLTQIKCTIDNVNDFKLVKQVVSEIKNRPILLKDIVELFSRKRELLNINKDSDPYLGYYKSIDDVKQHGKRKKF